MHSPKVITRGARLWPEPGGPRKCWPMPYSEAGFDRICAPIFIQAHFVIAGEGVPTNPSWLDEAKASLSEVSTNWFWLYLVKTDPSDLWVYRTVQGGESVWNVSMSLQYRGIDGYPGDIYGTSIDIDLSGVSNGIQIAGTNYGTNVPVGSYRPMWGKENNVQPRWERTIDTVLTWQQAERSDENLGVFTLPDWGPTNETWQFGMWVYLHSVQTRWMYDNEPTVYAASGYDPPCTAP